MSSIKDGHEIMRIGADFDVLDRFKFGYKLNESRRGPGSEQGP